MAQSSSPLVNKNITKQVTHEYLYTSMVSHRGTPVSFAMIKGGKIFYSVLDMSNTEQNAQVSDDNDKNYWSAVKLDGKGASSLNFPTEITQVGYGVVPNFQIHKYGIDNKKVIDSYDSEGKPLDKDGKELTAQAIKDKTDPFYSSTARLGAEAPFQVLSDGKYIYVFRQSITGDDSSNEKTGKEDNVPIVNNTLLVDRFILSGTVLKLSREIRYQRSRHKTEPESRKDTLAAVDVEGNPFYEPTRELVFANNLSNGNFSVLLMPGADSEEQRWQIFTADSVNQKVNSFNIRFDYSIVFDTSDGQTVVDEFIQKHGLDNSFIADIQAKINEGKPDDAITNDLSKKTPFHDLDEEAKKALKDALSEVAYTVRTGVSKDDFLLESTSEWPLIEYEKDGSSIKPEYLKNGALNKKYTFKGSSNELKPHSSPYKLHHGLSSCYYYQQETGPDGKPLKNKACVMLALGLEDKNANKYIGILNFSAAASGRLSRLTTDNVNMPDINVQALDENPYDTLEQIPTDDANRVAWQQPQKMRLLDIDPNGLSTSGGVLKFAYTSAAIGKSAGYSDAVEATDPYLFDDSLGRVNLYFKGKHDNFFVLYFNPTGSKSIQVTDSSESAKAADPPLSLKPRLDRDMTVKVAVNVTDKSNTCKLTMVSSGEEVEQWNHLPRRFSQISGILNGNSELPLGTLEPLGEVDDSRAAYRKASTGNGTLSLRTTVDNNLLFQVEQAHGNQLADGKEHTLPLSDLSVFLANNTTLRIAKKSFALVGKAVLKADVFYDSYLSGMVGDLNEVDEIWEYLKNKKLIQEVTGTTVKKENIKKGNLRSASLTGTYDTLSAVITDADLEKLSLPSMQDGNEADKKARRARLKQSLIALILDVAKVRMVTFTVQDTNTQSVDRLEAGLTVSVVYDYSNHFTCTPANLDGTSVSKWDHARSYLFNAELQYDENSGPTTEVSPDFNYQYSINNTIGQWEDWEASLALELNPKSATNGAVLHTSDSGKLEALQPTAKGLSVEAWVKPSSARHNRGSILCYQKDDQHYSLGIEKDSADTSKYKCVATLGDKKYTSKNTFAFDQWRHLAFTHKKYWGYELESGNTINCGNDSSLQLSDEFSLEALVQINTKGTLFKKEDEYELSVDGNKRLVFTWTGKDQIAANPYSLDAFQKFHKITLIRSRNKPQTDPTKTEYPISGNSGNPSDLLLMKNTPLDSISQAEVVTETVIIAKLKYGDILIRFTDPNENKKDYRYLVTDPAIKSLIDDLNSKAGESWDLNRLSNEDQGQIISNAKSITGYSPKWYENENDDTNLLKGMAEKHDQLESKMELSQTNIFGPVVDPSSEYNSTYYHTLIITDSNNNSKEWTTAIPKEVASVEAFKDFVMGGDGFTGTFASVRVWNRALSTSEAKALPVPENKAGLLSHWRMAEGKGKYLYDNVSENHGVANGGNWTDSPQSNQPGQFHFFVDGSPEAHDPPTKVNAQGVNQLSIGGINKAAGYSDHFKGILEEIRIWNIPRTNEQITDNAFGRLKGEWEQLLANYTFDKLISQTDGKVQDASVNSVQLTIRNETMLREVLSTAPIATEIPQVRSALTGVLTDYNGNIRSRPAVVEYGDVQKNDDGTLNGILKRCYSFIDECDDWNRMTGYKVGNLISQWYGQAPSNLLNKDLMPKWAT